MSERSKRRNPWAPHVSPGGWPSVSVLTAETGAYCVCTWAISQSQSQNDGDVGHRTGQVCMRQYSVYGVHWFIIKEKSERGLINMALVVGELEPGTMADYESLKEIDCSPGSTCSFILRRRLQTRAMTTHYDVGGLLLRLSSPH